MKPPFLGDPIGWSQAHFERFGPVSVLPMFGVRKMAVLLGRTFLPALVSEVLMGSGLGAAADEVHAAFETCLRPRRRRCGCPVPGLASSRSLAAVRGSL